MVSPVRNRATTLSERILDFLLDLLSVWTGGGKFESPIAADPLLLYNNLHPKAAELSSMELPPRFIADAMLGKLAKWLRILGIDVGYDRVIDNQVLIRHAKLEGRVILTRNKQLAQRRWGGSLRFMIIEEDHLPGQLRQFFHIYGPPIKTQMLTRCIRCNEPLISFPREKAAAHVPPFVYRTQQRFFRCPNCTRIYWPGTHQIRMVDAVNNLISQHPPEQPQSDNKK
jgi:uncharacterized protein